ncbi:MAG: exodeoxyribonuclease VII large subunit [Bdellovibrionales bacterium]|nr:exodeoxyribonuclease VII large subunit [Bdellovibrionales bacterium]
MDFELEYKEARVGASASDWRQNVPTVSKLNRLIRGHIENSFFDVFVRGEVSNLKRPSSGHGYFVLKDQFSQLRAVIFRPFLSRLKFDLEDGMEVILHGKVTVYEARGDYQIVCDAVEPVGVGALQLAFEQLKTKLEKEGLFESSRKRELPYLPKRIGIVTSPTGAAVRDILHVLNRRFPKLEVLLFPTAVQGDRAAGEIVEALRKAEHWCATQPDRKLDLLIVGRGGGSIEDLWPFNEEVVARALASCSIPIISAVGHEIDFTISDFVADRRAPTPSAAAEIAVPEFTDLQSKITAMKRQLVYLMRRRLEDCRLRVDHAQGRLLDPRDALREQKRQLIEKQKQIARLMIHQIQLQRGRFQSATQLLNSLSPLGVLSRGYSLTRIEPRGTILRSVVSVRTGDKLTTSVADGEVLSQVLSKSPIPS